MKINTLKNLSALAIAVLISSCGSNTSETMDNTLEDTSTEHQAPEINTSVEIKEGQKVFFTNLEDEQEITLPFYAEFGVEGMEVEPAGVVNADKGHHHLIVDNGYLEAGKMVPTNDTYKHFGKGQLGDSITLDKYPTLTPGKHTLTLQFGDGIHTSYGEKMSSTVEVIVK